MTISLPRRRTGYAPGESSSYRFLLLQSMVRRVQVRGRRRVYAGPFDGRRKAQAKVAVNLLGRVIEVVIGVEALAAIG